MTEQPTTTTVGARTPADDEALLAHLLDKSSDIAARLEERIQDEYADDPGDEARTLMLLESVAAGIAAMALLAARRDDVIWRRLTREEF